jgi:ribonuclease D
MMDCSRPRRTTVTLVPITTDTALDAAAAGLAALPRLALDTEFMRERTYYAELALVQLAGRDGVVLVDPLAGLAPALLQAILSVPGQTKVLHAARQDVEVLLPLTGAPLAPLFDTQVAAGLLGYAPQIGYGELVLKELGQALEKGHARTDWLRRPLSPAQLDYAADDVRWLLPLAARLEEGLAAKGRLDWLAADLAALADPGLYRTDPALAWQRLKGIEVLPVAEQRRLRRLAAWREERAMRRNLPRGWVLTDDAARMIARRPPDSVAALKALEVMPPGAADKMGSEIIEALMAAAGASDEGIVQRQDTRPDPAERERTRRLGERLKAVALELSLAPEVIATQRDLRQLAHGEPLDVVLQGWRRTVLGPALAAELALG